MCFCGLEDKVMEEYKGKIIEFINSIENLNYLEFIYNMLIAFKKKWGI